jgi:polysaccharide export outer membrane protein
MRPRRFLALFALVVLLADSGPSRSAQTPYRLDTGDVVEIDVFGMADLKRRAAVDVDGDVAFPFVGFIHAAGLSLAELRASVANSLVQGGAMQNPQVTIEIVEHRPFFVTGDVAHPGAIPYRKGLTVRHAVALAGGFDALRFRTENPLMMAPDLKSAREALRVDWATVEVRIASLKAEMDGRAEFNAPSLPAGGDVVKSIIDGEQKALAERLQEWAKQTEFQQRKISSLQADVDSLTSSLRQQGDAAKYQAAALERTSGGAAKGVTALDRVDEERRALAQIDAQETDAGARLAEANRELAAAVRDMDRMRGERQERLNKEAEALVVEREKISLQVKASAEKLLYAGAIKAQLRHSAGLRIAIRRISGGVRTTLQGDEDSEILPDDVIDIQIDPEKIDSD